MSPASDGHVLKMQLVPFSRSSITSYFHFCITQSSLFCLLRFYIPCSSLDIQSALLSTSRSMLSICSMLPSIYVLSILFLAATVFAGPQPMSDFCETDSCAKVLLEHPALSYSFCQKSQENNRYPWRPSQSELLVRPPVPNHPLYAAACFVEEDYADSVAKACDCVPR